MKKTIIMSILTFILFYLISHFIPLTGDDWTNANYHNNNIIYIINVALDKYFIHEGRIISRIFVLFFTNTKWLWEIFNALVMTGIFIGLNRIVNSKHNTIVSMLLFISMICLERTMFMQSYVWVTGNCTYTVPMAFGIIYFLLMNKIWGSNFKQSKITIVVCCLLNFMASMMVENISAALVFANILFLGYYYWKNKKISKNILAYFIISLLGLAVMLLSPGAHSRMLTENETFANYNIFEKCITNLPLFINWTFISNTVLIATLSIILFLLIYKNYKNIAIRIVSVIYLIVPFITIGVKLLTAIASKSSKARFILQYTDWLIDPSNIATIIYWCIFIGLMIFVTIKFVDKDKEKYKALFFLLVGLSANLAMLMAPIWGGRTAIFTVFMLYIFAYILLNEVNINKLVENIIKYILIAAVIAITTIFTMLYYNVYKLQQDREKYISEQITEGKETIEVYLFPEYALHNANAWNAFHQNSFKNYYGIDSDVNLERIKTKWKWGIFYQE